MEDIKKKSGIIISTVLIVFAVIILYFRFVDKEDTLHYSMNAEEMAYELLMVAHVSPDEAMKLMWDTATVFVDMRPEKFYTLDHIENAINIPATKILDEESLERFDQWKKDSLRVVVYCNNEMQATSPWMVLYQLGYTNTQILMGGMNYINALYSDNPPAENAYNVEAPNYDYSGIIEAAASASPEEVQAQPQRKVVVRKKTKKAAEGGC